MDKILTYLTVFAVGGALCAIAQLILVKTKITPARILLIFLFAGIVLQAVGLFEPIKEFAHSGVTVPITGFGASLAKGAVEGLNKQGFLGIIGGGLEATAVGVGAAIAFSYIIAIFFNSKSK